jgi:hypothetical protein
MALKKKIRYTIFNEGKMKLINAGKKLRLKNPDPFLEYNFPSSRHQRQVKDTTSPTACWKHLFTEEMLEVLAEHTNKYTDSVKELYSRERAATLTSKCKVKSPDLSSVLCRGNVFKLFENEQSLS